MVSLTINKLLICLATNFFEINRITTKGWSTFIRVPLPIDWVRICRSNVSLTNVFSDVWSPKELDISSVGCGCYLSRFQVDLFDSFPLLWWCVVRGYTWPFSSRIHFAPKLLTGLKKSKSRQLIGAFLASTQVWSICFFFTKNCIQNHKLNNKNF